MSVCSPLLTIVVPVYNVEKYLKQCLDSLLYQTVMNHKVIIVDDGSRDSSGKIAQEYADRYSEVFTCIHQKNAGLSAARNAGLKLVETEYVGFLDSDDWVPSNYIEGITNRINKAVEAPDLIFTLPTIYDMATGEYHDWYDKQILERVFHHSDTTVTSAQKNPELLELEPNACRRIMSMKFIKKLNFSFTEGTKWEDIHPHFQELHAAHRCIAYLNGGFFYRTNSGNQITSSSSADRIQTVTVFQETLLDAMSNGWSAVECAYIFRMMFKFIPWAMACCSVKVRPQFVKTAHQLYRSIPKEMFQIYYETLPISKKERLFNYMLRSPIFYRIADDATYYKHTIAVVLAVVRKLKRK